MRSIVVGVVAAATVIACNSTRPVTADERAALQQHEAQWAQRSFHSYVFDYSEAQLNTNYDVRITVRNDTLSDVIDLQTGHAPVVPRSWPTMDALFNEANFAVQQGGATFEYDEQYGYLTLFRVVSNNSGSGFLARISNLQPLQ
jgi:hypothetical protein